MIASALACAFAGMAALCFAMDRNWRRFGSGGPSSVTRTTLRSAAAAAFASGLAACVAHWGWAMGVVAWVGALSVAGLCVVLLVAYAPRTAAALAVAAWPIGALSLLV